MNATSITRTTIAAGLALLTLGTGEAASADRYGAGIFTGSGGGISTVEDDGDVTFTGPGLVSDRRLEEMLDATLTVVVSPDGGVLPALGSCTDATSTFVFEGKRGVAMTLDGAGQVCTRAFTPSSVQHVFEGTFDVVDAQRPDLRGTSGDHRVSFTPNGFTSAYAITSVA